LFGFLFRNQSKFETLSGSSETVHVHSHHCSTRLSNDTGKSQRAEGNASFAEVYTY
jgi:hypothetical protein